MKPPKNDPNREEIKKKAISAKNRLWTLINGDKTEISDKHQNIIPLVCQEFDKYGRLLVSIFPNNYNMDNIVPENIESWFNQTINYQMIQEGP
jgi:hypothetical protein